MMIVSKDKIGRQGRIVPFTHLPVDHPSGNLYWHRALLRQPTDYSASYKHIVRRNEPSEDFTEICAPFPTLTAIPPD